MLENSTVDIDYNNIEYLPCGAQRLTGTLTKQRRKVEVLIYGKNDLIYVSADGTNYKKHLDLELRVHRSLMQSTFYDEDDASAIGGATGSLAGGTPINKEEDSDIVPNIGKSETKMGLSASDTEIRVVNELMDDD